MRRVIAALVLLLPALAVGACRQAPPGTGDAADGANAALSGAWGGGGGGGGGGM